MVCASTTAPPRAAPNRQPRIAAALLLCICSTFATAGVAHAVPRASDFERTVTLPAQSGGARSSAQRLLTIEPGREFELAGFRWSGAAPSAIAVRSYGARGWSSWSELAISGEDAPDAISPVPEDGRQASDPIWTGPAWKLQARVSGGGRKLRAHFVRVATGPAAHTSSTGGVSPSGGAGKGGHSSAEAPAIVPRAQWGAKSCKPRYTPGYGEILSAVVHHTESTNSYSQSEAPGVVLGICRYHRFSKGWNDIGYNLLIDRFGTVYEGRAGGVEKAVIGAHAQGYNSQTTGIALIGGFMTTDPPEAALDSLKRVIEWKLGLAGITRNERSALVSTGGGFNRYPWGKTVFTRPVSGHRDLDSTDCPGNVLYGRLPELASFLSGGSRPATKLNLRVKRVRSGNGQVIAVSGRLRSGGKGVGGKPVNVEAFTTKGWVPIAEAQTAGDGLWQTTVAPKGRYYLRGSFAGDDGLRSVRSLWIYSPKIRRPS